MLNTDEFLQTVTEEALDDTLIPCPPGEWIGIASKPVVKQFEYKAEDRKGETGYRLVINWAIQDQEPKDVCGRDKVSVTQSLLLDITEDGSGIDMGKGKNIGLGKVRTALGQNVPGQPWAPAMIEGQPAKIKVKAGIYNDNATAEVEAVTAAA